MNVVNINILFVFIMNVVNLKTNNIIAFAFNKKSFCFCFCFF